MIAARIAASRRTSRVAGSASPSMACRSGRHWSAAGLRSASPASRSKRRDSRAPRVFLRGRCHTVPASTSSPATSRDGPGSPARCPPSSSSCSASVRPKWNKRPLASIRWPPKLLNSLIAVRAMRWPTSLAGFAAAVSQAACTVFQNVAAVRSACAAPAARRGDRRNNGADSGPHDPSLAKQQHPRV